MVHGIIGFKIFGSGFVVNPNFDGGEKCYFDLTESKYSQLIFRLLLITYIFSLKAQAIADANRSAFEILNPSEFKVISCSRVERKSSSSDNRRIGKAASGSTPMQKIYLLIPLASALIRKDHS